MSTWRLLRAYLRSRPLMTLLSVLLIALAVATMTIVAQVTSQFSQRLERDTAGLELVVGAKGSPMQLVLGAVHQIDVPPGAVPAAAVAQLFDAESRLNAIPLALGDSWRGWRIVGTTSRYPAHYHAYPVVGRMFAQPMEAVLGAAVARATGASVGSQFHAVHGLDGPAGSPAPWFEHREEAYRIVGVLAPTGSVVDRLVLTPVESVWRTHHDGAAGAVDERDLTAVLLRSTGGSAPTTLAHRIGADPRLQAAIPAQESARLLALVGVGTDAVRGFGAVVLAAAALSVFVALVQALSDRRYELALMRLLGATPRRLFALLMLEGAVLTAAGVLVGLLLGHLALATVGSWLLPRGEFALHGWQLGAWELQFGLLVMVLGTLAALLPATKAARTPIAGVLAGA